MEYADYYAILGVERKASSDEIKRAYRKLARKYHPDVSKEKNAEEQFKRVQEAYEVLKDADKRAAYDQLGNHWRQGQEFRPPPGWENVNFGGAGSQSGFSAEDLQGFSDFFTQLFGGGGGGRRRAKSSRSTKFYEDTSFGGGSHGPGYADQAQDEEAVITISLEEAFHGATKSIDIRSNGSGLTRRNTRRLKVNIPPGSLPGKRLRLAGQAGGGDLYLKIELSPHPWFTLVGHDIYLTLPVTPWEAALGTELKIPTLGGKVGMKIAPGAYNGQKLRLRGRGMPTKGGQGDQYVVLSIEIPQPTTVEQTDLYRKMAKLMPFNPRKF